jgi:hypothetical protein
VPLEVKEGGREQAKALSWPPKLGNVRTLSGDTKFPLDSPAKAGPADTSM